MKSMHKAKVDDVIRSIYTVTYVLLDSLPVIYYRGATILSLKRQLRSHYCVRIPKMFRRTGGTEVFEDSMHTVQTTGHSINRNNHRNI